MRSSVAPGGDRHHRGDAGPHAPGSCDPRSPGGAPATGSRCSNLTATTCCDPRSPRGATATQKRFTYGRGPWGCDPRSPRGATATPCAQPRIGGQESLRSSVAPGGDRHCPRGRRPPSRGESCDPRSPRGATATTAGPCSCPPGHQLRSSVAPGGDRHTRLRVNLRTGVEVAILGRPGGRPPPPHRPRSRLDRGCDPRSPRGATATSSRLSSSTPTQALRSSVAPGGDRHSSSGRSHPGRDRVAILGRPGGRPPPPADFAAAATATCCDPRSPRGATATLPEQRKHHTRAKRLPGRRHQRYAKRSFCFGVIRVSCVCLRFRSGGVTGRDRLGVAVLRRYLGSGRFRIPRGADGRYGYCHSPR